MTQHGGDDRATMPGALIVAHHERADAGPLARSASEWLRGRGWQVWMVKEDAAALDLPELASDRPPGESDLAISLGGDGTMLRTVDLLAGSRTDILGVNVGLLGYLSEVEPAGLAGALERYVQGDFVSEERMLLAVNVVDPDRPVAPDVAVVEHDDDVDVDVDGTVGVRRRTWRALNDAVIERRESGHTVRLGVSIGGVPFTTYAADGLIVATPTGSTAYSLSARGPVVSPGHRALLLTAVSPHTLFDRALVLDPEESVEIEVLGHRRADLNVDGQRARTLEPGSTVHCSAANEPARFVRFGPRRFHQILKAKFGLSDR
jgi:NAD+ kinase